MIPMEQRAGEHGTDLPPAEASLTGAVLEQLRLLPESEIIAILRTLDPALLRSALAPQDTSSEQGANRRGSQRNRTLRSGKIIYNNQMCVIDCLIRDISETGCRIRVANPGAVPNHFVLHVLGTNRKYTSDICWRTAQELGVKFAG